MSQTMLIVYEDAVQLQQRNVEGESEIAHGLTVTGTFLEGKMIARCVGEPDEAVTAAPRKVVYVGKGICPVHGLRAELFALVPWKKEEWQPESPDAEVMMVFLGNLVRVPQDLKGLDRESEFLDHFKEVMTGNAAPKIDRILPHL